jgi:hypothetical protein
MIKVLFIITGVLVGTLVGRYLETKLAPKIGARLARVLLVVAFWGIAISAYFGLFAE